MPTPHDVAPHDVAPHDVAPHDVLTMVLGEPTAAERRLRAARPEVFAGVQRSYESLVDAQGGLAPRLRLAVALRVAALSGSPALAGWFGELAEDADVPAELAAALVVARPVRTTDDAMRACLELASASAAAPASVDDRAIAAFLAAGFDHRELVTLMQLTAFVAYLARLVQGLAALRAVGRAA